MRLIFDTYPTSLNQFTFDTYPASLFWLSTFTPASLKSFTFDIYLSLFEKFNFWHLPCLSEEVQELVELFEGRLDAL